MTRKKYYIVYFLTLLLFFVLAEKTKAQYRVQLFPDRSFCVSGDTLWFSTIIMPEHTIAESNVVHVQLDNTENKHITKVSVLCKDNRGQGYLPIPDSLSTGVYLLKAFSNNMKSNNQIPVSQCLLTVYHRFDNNIDMIATPHVGNVLPYAQAEGFEILTEQEMVATNEKVNVKVKIPIDKCPDLSEIIITAGMADPLSENFNSFCISASQKENNAVSMSLDEKNGILLSGTVFSAEGNTTVPGAIVLLSIPDTIPYFDYCIADSKGAFWFYLRNATGTANLIIQARTKEQKACKIKLAENYIKTEENFNFENKVLTYEQKNFAETVVNAAYFNKLFSGYRIAKPEPFSIACDFNFPFYGEPTTTVYPELFIDLPDFTEISRELLHGVQFRQKNDGTTIRMYNYGGEEVFREEPLKLLDGIPVFDPAFFADMGTKDIKKVDEVFYERFFGDISFKGVLAVYSKKRSLSWIESYPDVQLFNYPCLQVASDWTLKNKQKAVSNAPDFRRVFYRENTTEIRSEKEFSFSVSDLKGKLAIRVIAITRQNQILYFRKLIDIQ